MVTVFFAVVKTADASPHDLLFSPPPSMCIGGTEIYKKGDRKIKYFTDDLKQEKITVNQEEETIKIIQSREDSYDRLTCECEKEFADKSECTEEETMRNLMIEKVHEALKTLSETESQIIYGLFFEGKTGKTIAGEFNVSEMAISKRK